MGSIINTDEEHNIISEASGDLRDDCNTIRMNFIARMKVICWAISDSNFVQKT